MHRTSFFVSTAAAVLFALALPSQAQAQTEGRISVGGSVTFLATSDDDVSSAVTVGPLVRLNPRRGWGPAGALNWFQADLSNPAGGDADFARLRVRPLMGGLSYTVGPDRDLISFSVVAGPSFNSVDFEDAYLNGLSSVPTIDVDHSFAFRPGVGLTHTLAPRVAMTGFAGYIFNRPDVTYRNGAGETVAATWKADSLVLSVGLVYSLF